MKSFGDVAAVPVAVAGEVAAVAEVMVEVMMVSYVVEPLELDWYLA